LVIIRSIAEKPGSIKVLAKSSGLKGAWTIINSQ
jgi:hypothetical protein